ncbi:UNVERIFIED_CONTAM: hypothetical protein K2H54_004992 [Gekko kuhli]
MSSPRSAPIYAWGEKPGPSRIEEEEEDRRPPEEEEVEETVPVPVPATSLPEKKQEGWDAPEQPTLEVDVGGIILSPALDTWRPCG